MKYLKTYEELENIPSIGDYIQVGNLPNFDTKNPIEAKEIKMLTNFMLTNISKVVSFIFNDKNEYTGVYSEWYDIPESIQKYFPKENLRKRSLKKKYFRNIVIQDQDVVGSCPAIPTTDNQIIAEFPWLIGCDL